MRMEGPAAVFSLQWKYCMGYVDRPKALGVWALLGSW